LPAVVRKRRFPKTDEEIDKSIKTYDIYMSPALFDIITPPWPGCKATLTECVEWVACECGVPPNTVKTWLRKHARWPNPEPRKGTAALFNERERLRQEISKERESEGEEEEEIEEEEEMPVMRARDKLFHERDGESEEEEAGVGEEEEAGVRGERDGESEEEEEGVGGSRLGQTHEILKERESEGEEEEEMQARDKQLEEEIKSAKTRARMPRPSSKRPSSYWTS
jgi:hypothetical protein